MSSLDGSFFPIPPQDNYHSCFTPHGQSNGPFPHHLTEIAVQEKVALGHPPDHQHNSWLLELWLAQLCPCIPALLSLGSPWHCPSHPQPCPGRGSPKQEQRHQPRGEICCVPFTPPLRHGVCSKDAPGNKLSSGVSLCYTTFPAVRWLFNFSLECQTFCSLALKFLQLPAVLIALCCQTADCFFPP